VIPFYVMLVGILAARVIGTLGWEPLDGWRAATRVGLALMFCFTAVAHFTRTRADLIRMVPPRFPNPAALVTATGIAEFAGAIGLLIPGLARWAAYGLILLLFVMFPANAHAAGSGHSIGGRPHTAFPIRLLLQVLWIWLLWWSVT
jgi:uncharacterized membrane protein